MADPTADRAPSTFLDSLGARGLRRAEPRASIAIAGAGCALAVLGVLIVAADTGSGDGEFNRWPGIVLSALVIAAGVYTLRAVGSGPIAAAGTVAAALGVPPLMFFVTFDEGGFPPYSTDAILIVSTLAWLAAYLVGPGRGRPFFLAAGLVSAWLTIMQLAEQVFDLPYTIIGGFAPIVVEPSFDEELGPFSPDPVDPILDTPDPTTLGLISLAFGIGYLLVTRRLDRRGSHGAATPFAFATLPAIFAGVLFLADELEQAGTGVFLMAVGAWLAYHGATVGRRATAWVGGAATGIGAAVFLSDMTDDPTVGGMLFLAGGIALVAAGHALSNALSEPDEMELTDHAAAMPAAVAVRGADADDRTEAAPAPPPSADDPWAPPPAPPAPPPAPPAEPGPPDDEWAPPGDRDDEPPTAT